MGALCVERQDAPYPRTSVPWPFLPRLHCTAHSLPPFVFQAPFNEHEQACAYSAHGSPLLTHNLKLAAFDFCLDPNSRPFSFRLLGLSARYIFARIHTWNPDACVPAAIETDMRPPAFTQSPNLFASCPFYNTTSPIIEPQSLSFVLSRADTSPCFEESANG